MSSLQLSSALRSSSSLHDLHVPLASRFEEGTQVAPPRRKLPLECVETLIRWHTHQVAYEAAIPRWVCAVEAGLAECVEEAGVDHVNLRRPACLEELGATLLHRLLVAAHAAAPARAKPVLEEW